MPSAARSNPIILTTPRRPAVDPRQWLETFEIGAALRADPWLWGSAAALILLGLMMVLNTTYFMGLEKHGNPFYFFERQLINLAAGLAVMTLAAQLSLRGLRDLALPLMAVAVIVSIAVWFPGLGIVRGGARRWLRIGPVLIEPSETLKIATV